MPAWVKVMVCLSSVAQIGEAALWGRESLAPQAGLSSSGKFWKERRAQRGGWVRCECRFAQKAEFAKFSERP
ncbi:hypothetical protein NBRC116597_05720 [Phaeobacter sp. NW0010-22]